MSSRFLRGVKSQLVVTTDWLSRAEYRSQNERRAPIRIVLVESPKTYTFRRAIVFY